MSGLFNLDLLSVGVSIAAIAILGSAVYLSNKNSITSKTFLLFSIITIAYGVVNFLNYKVRDPFLVLLFLRLTIFFAVLHAFTFFQLFYVFPKDKVIFGKLYKNLLVPLVFLVALLNLTPLVFVRIVNLAPIGQVSNPERGPGIVLFGAMTFFLILGGFYTLAKRILNTTGLEQKQLKIVSIGTEITFFLIIVCNFILPIFFNYLRLIPLAPVFFLPFIAFTTYAIIKHHFLNIKIIATEILTFVLAVASLLDVIISNDIYTLLIRSFVFLLVLAFGVMLIKSVRKEVKQREKLEILDKELESANEKLKALDQARAEFITIASHQLRTPPATIKWYLSAVLGGDYGVLPPDIKDSLEKAQRTNNGLISLIDDMLNVSRIERGKMEFLFQETDCEAMANEIYEQLLPIAIEKKLELIYHKPLSPLPKIMADKEKVKQVMNNMVDNALKYTKAGSVEMALFLENKNIRFEVKDTGKGFDKEEQEAIFEKYRRGKNAQNHSAGLGLGMYVGKAIIDQHNGKIWGESQGVGKGSTFAFTLPINNNLKATTLLDLANPNKIQPS